MTKKKADNYARRMTGGEALADMLRAYGVGPMFGMGGFQLLPFYEAVRALGLEHHLINDERCGAFAADAYARVTNRAGRVRRDARAGGDESGDRPGRIAQCRHAAGRHHRRRQPRACLEEHDAGRRARSRSCAPAVQGTDPRRGGRAASPSWCAAPSRWRPRAGPARWCSTCRRTSATASYDFAADDFWVDEATLSRSRRRRIATGRRTTWSAPRRCSPRPSGRCMLVGGGIHQSVAYERAAGAGRGAEHSRRAYHDRQGLHRLHASAVGRALRALFPHRQRPHRNARTACSWSAASSARSRPSASRSSAGRAADPSRHRGRGDRPHDAQPTWRCGATHGGAARTCWLNWRTRHRRRRRRARNTSPRCRCAWPNGRTRRPTGSIPSERPINMARLMNELNKAMPADSAAGRRWRLRRALDRAALRHQAGRPAFHRRSRLRLDRLRAAGRHRRRARPAGRTGRRHHRRRRLQHDDRRPRDRAPLQDRRDDHGRQQRGVRLRQGAAALGLRRAISRRDLVEMNYAKIAERLRLPGHPRRGPGKAGRCDQGRHGGNANARPSSTSSSPATPPRCCPPSTTACSRWRRATGRFRATCVLSDAAELPYLLLIDQYICNQLN